MYIYSLYIERERERESSSSFSTFREMISGMFNHEETSAICMVSDFSFVAPLLPSPRNRRSPKRRPAAIATGVSSYPVLVASAIETNGWSL